MTKWVSPRAVIAGIVIGAVATTGIALADSGSQADSGDSDHAWPAPGEIPPDTSEPPADPAPYAHLGDRNVPEGVLETCTERTLQGVGNEETGPVTEEDTLQCEALIGLAKGSLAPGDYSRPELEAAVEEAESR